MSIICHERSRFLTSPDLADLDRSFGEFDFGICYITGAVDIEYSIAARSGISSDETVLFALLSILSVDLPRDLWLDQCHQEVDRVSCCQDCSPR